MGVPNFYSWLCSRYPLIKAAYDEKTLPIVDELYLDLNGIIYKCVNDDTSVFKDMLKGRRFEEIWINAMNYINEIIQLVKPGKLLFLAFDGVAPRAKMNQQRSRRFKAARKYDELDESLRKGGVIEKEEHFKNNSISPGTEFMFELNRQIRFFIQRKMMEDVNWRKLKVIFSGVDNEGEGEHKILEYIRRGCQQKDFDPNKSICFYGPDADLIHLALSTHLKNVMILREEIGFRSKLSTATRRNLNQTKYDVLYIGVLREYFLYEFSALEEKMGPRFNLERIIDDFIFLCFFIGNDFLPRVFCMDVKKGSFDKVIEIFKKTMIENNDYIIEKGVIIWGRAVKLFKAMAEFELESFNEKLQEQQYALRNSAEEKRMWEDHLQEIANEEDMTVIAQMKEEFVEIEQAEEGDEELAKKVVKTKKTQQKKQPSDPKKIVTKPENSESKIEENKEQPQGQEGAHKFEKPTIDTKAGPRPEEEKLSDSSSASDIIQTGGVIKNFLSSMALEKDIDFMTSLIKLYKEDRSEMRNFYYQEKFGFDSNKNRKELLNLLTKYMEGLQFVLSYYYTNCPSWSWYFPYHYSPLISDLANLLEYLHLPTTENKRIQFETTKPYDPFKQLMLILPTNSSHLLPECFRNVISNPSNPLNPYYPTTFSVDPFGAAFESEYIALIPFVDEELLHKEYEKIDKSALKPEEALRNKHQPNIVYEWDDNAEPTLVKTTLPYFDDFTIRVKTSYFEIYDIPFNPENIYLDEEVMNLSFPSLELHPNKTVKMESFTKRKVDFRRCCFTLKSSYEPTQYKDILEKKFYFGYPVMRECTLLAIITPAEIISNYKPEDLGYDYNKARHAAFYQDFLANYGPFLYEDLGLKVEGPEVHIAVIDYPYEYRKYYDGAFYPMTTMTCLPFPFLIEKKFDVKFRTSLGSLKPKIEEEFPKGKSVVINVGPATGSTAYVTKYAKAFRNQLDVEVRTVRYMREDIGKMVKKIAMEYESHQAYWRVQDVADNLGLAFETVLSILGSIIVKSDQSINAKSIYAEKFDVGLNLVKPKYNMLVPELIIYDEKGKGYGERTKHFFLSPEAKELVDEYYKNLRPIVVALEDRLKTRNPEPLNAKGIFQDSEDPNLDLLKAYIWVLKTENSNLIQSNQSSKVLPREGIRTIEQYMRVTRNERSKPPPKQAEFGTYNPNQLYPHNEDNWIPPSFVEQPQWHFVGDRVVNLKCCGYSFAPFGAQGTVVGILGNKFENDVLEVKIEVLFDDPFIGGTNLGGRCSWGRGAVVNFTDVYNIKWSKSIIPRDKTNFDLSVWDGSFRRRYIPKFNDLSSHSPIPSLEDENAEKIKTEKATKNIYDPLADKTKEKKIVTKPAEEQAKKTEEPQIEYVEAPLPTETHKGHQKQTHVVPKSTVVQKKIVTKQDSGNTTAAKPKPTNEAQKVSETKTQPQTKASVQSTQSTGGGFSFDNFLQENATTLQVSKTQAPSGKTDAPSGKPAAPEKKKLVAKAQPFQATTLTSESILSQIQGPPTQKSTTSANSTLTAESILSQIQGGPTTQTQPAGTTLTAESILSQIKDEPVIKAQPKESQGFDFDGFAKNMGAVSQQQVQKEHIVTEYKTEDEKQIKIAVEVKKTAAGETQNAGIDTQSLLNVLGVNPAGTNTESNPQASLEKDLVNLLGVNKDNAQEVKANAQEVKETGSIDEAQLKSILQINPADNK